MARSTPAVQQVVIGGLTVALTAPSVDGDNFAPGKYGLWVANGAGAPITVTIQTPATVAGLAVAEAGGAVPNGSYKIFGPFPASVFAQPADQPDVGLVRVDYSSITSITRGLFKL